MPYAQKNDLKSWGIFDVLRTDKTSSDFWADLKKFSGIEIKYSGNILKEKWVRIDDLMVY